MVAQAATRLRLIQRVVTTGLALASAFAAVEASATDAAITSFSAAPVGDPPTAWKFATLPHKTPTRFFVAEVDGTRVLKVEADDSYGTLVHAMMVQPVSGTSLAWRWRVDRLVDGADIQTRQGDDSPIKVCVFFAFDAARLSLGERTKLSIARSTTGQDVPAETMCYVWDNRLAVDTSIANAFTKRVRYIVLQSGPSKLGQWVSQKRDVSADYARLFSDEAEGQIPEITGIAVAADADNTHAHALAYVGDIILQP